MDSRGREDVPGSGSVDGDIGSVGSFDRGFERAAADVADASSSSSSSQHEAESIAVVKARSGGRRRSCNRCSSKKERCDGQEPCQRCVRFGLECLYATCRTLGRPRSNASTTSSKRSPSGPRKISEGSGANPSRKGTGAATPSGSEAFSSGNAGNSIGTIAKAGAAGTQAATGGARSSSVTGTVRVRPTVPEAATTTATVSVSSPKRSSLSASPATGLKGLVENVYLNRFVEDFACFFRVLDDSTIRLGLISLMTDKVDVELLAEAGRTKPPPAKRRSRAVTPGRRRSASAPGSSLTTVARSSPTALAGKTALEGELSTEDLYAINSSVFSALALGALLAGQVPSHVQQYVEVAEASLRICGSETAAVPNKHVAAAHLLLAFASNVAGREEYLFHIRLTRECYEACVNRGLYTPPPICEILLYRAIIDALGKPLNASRVPSPRDSEIPAVTDIDSVSCASLSERVIPVPIDDGQIVKGDGETPHRRGHGQGHRNGRGRRDRAQASVGNAKVSGVVVAPTTATADSKLFAIALDGARDGVGNQAPPGLEAARERGRRRRAEPLFMVCDIMTVLSKVPWSTTEDSARRTQEQLREIRSLVVAEKALLEERRSAKRGRQARTSEWMEDYTLNSAMIGLHCALDEFAELLGLGRGLARCISSCPGLARYNAHVYHAALAILRAFGKGDEFDALVREVPKELRFAAPSGRSLSFAVEEDMCTMPVCVRHARAILEMTKRHQRGEAEMVTIARDAEDDTAAAIDEQPDSPAVSTTLTLPSQQLREEQCGLLPDSTSSVERDRLDSSIWRSIDGGGWCEESASAGASTVAARDGEALDEWSWVRPCSPPWGSTSLGSALGNTSPIVDSVDNSAAVATVSSAASISDQSGARHGARARDEGKSKGLGAGVTALPAPVHLGNADGDGVAEVAAPPPVGDAHDGASLMLPASREEQPEPQPPRSENDEIVDIRRRRAPAGGGYDLAGNAQEPWRQGNNEDGKAEDRGGGSHVGSGCDVSIGGVDSGKGGGGSCQQQSRDRGDVNFAPSDPLAANQRISQPARGSTAEWVTNTCRRGRGGDDLSSEGLTRREIGSRGASSPPLASAQQVSARDQYSQVRLARGGVLTNRLWGSIAQLGEARGEGLSFAGGGGGKRPSRPWPTNPPQPNPPAVSRYLMSGGGGSDVARAPTSIVAAAEEASASEMTDPAEAAVVAGVSARHPWEPACERQRAETTALPDVSAGVACDRAITAAAAVSKRLSAGISAEDRGCERGHEAGETGRGRTGSGGEVVIGHGGHEEDDTIMSLWKLMGDVDASE